MSASQFPSAARGPDDLPEASSLSLESGTYALPTMAELEALESEVVSWIEGSRIQEGTWDDYMDFLDDQGPYYAPTHFTLGREGPVPDIDWDLPFQACDRSWYVVQYHPQGLTCDQIAALFGKSKQRIHQIEQEALAKLRKNQPGTLRALLKAWGNT